MAAIDSQFGSLPWTVVRKDTADGEWDTDEYEVQRPATDGMDDWPVVVASIPGGDAFGPGNAHLIAAAPDLLAALERVVFHGENGGPAADDAFAKARAAIAKARGGA